MRRKQLAILFLMIGIIDVLIVGVLVGVTSGPVMGVTLAGGILVFMYATLAWLVPGITRMLGWGQLKRSYPCEDIAVFGTNPKIISVGLRNPMMNLNNCVEAMTDENHLHMRLGLPFTGDGLATSIPWEAVSSVEPASMGRVRLVIDGVKVWVPKWVGREELALREAMENEPAEAAGA